MQFIFNAKTQRCKGAKGMSHLIRGEAVFCGGSLLHFSAFYLSLRLGSFASLR
jgi:hypothetical protein